MQSCLESFIFHSPPVKTSSEAHPVNDAIDMCRNHAMMKELKAVRISCDLITRVTVAFGFTRRESAKMVHGGEGDVGLDNY